MMTSTSATNFLGKEKSRGSEGEKQVVSSYASKWEC